MSRVSLNLLPPQMVNEQQVESALERIVSKVRSTVCPREIVQASLDMKATYSKALQEGPQNSKYQQRISDLFCNARRAVSAAFIQSRFDTV